ncbi:hypothetical protein HYU17_02905 [Candidatus Woesearchaeota archaeon]|nr:hypothetical protein [Candidatus Woesearchaeota archaeon]
MGVVNWSKPLQFSLIFIKNFLINPSRATVQCPVLSDDENIAEMSGGSYGKSGRFLELAGCRQV